jgi:VanZ family protein
MLLTMAAIFCLSTQNGTDTNKTSGVVVNPIENKIKASSDKIFESENAETDYWKKVKNKINAAVRKSAHAVIFGVLGLFTILFFTSLGLDMGDAIVLTMLLCGLYAGSDEFHQHFVDGRTPRFSDVCIDMFGAWVSVLLVYVKGKLKVLYVKRKNKISA